MRFNGFYWVKCFEHLGWEIGEWYEGEWRVFGTPNWPMKDTDFEEIDERRIVRPLE